MTCDDHDGRRLQLARELVKHIEAGDGQAAGEVLSQLYQERDSKLFLKVGKLTRDLHETLNRFLLDNGISMLAQTDIPDARARLSYVIEMTEASAHRTLGAVEDSLPISQSIQGRIAHFQQAWQSFRRREMPIEAFRQLNHDMDGFLEQTNEDVSRIHQNLSEILMAQETQDLAGQVIRQVISLVQKVEDSLVEIISLTGQEKQESTDGTDAEALRRGTGPSLPGQGETGSVANQDEVDELLSSLGF